ncbi:hypothetical protein [Haladaptatus halobius]|nr:hypothetical protein [Haladaptatus halobius]
MLAHMSEALTRFARSPFIRQGNRPALPFPDERGTSHCGEFCVLGRG